MPTVKPLQRTSLSSIYVSGIASLASWNTSPSALKSQGWSLRASPQLHMLEGLLITALRKHMARNAARSWSPNRAQRIRAFRRAGWLPSKVFVLADNVAPSRDIIRLPALFEFPNEFSSLKLLHVGDAGIPRTRGAPRMSHPGNDGYAAVQECCKKDGHYEHLAEIEHHFAWATALRVIGKIDPALHRDKSVQRQRPAMMTR